MDALRALLDEVCLEGLDGITVDTLWLRLRTRSPVFPLTLEPPVHQYLWRALTCNPDVSFCLLPRERSPVPLHDRFIDIDPETGIQELPEQEREEFEDPYLVSVVQDDPQGIQGSCVYYKEREDITHLIRTPQLAPLLTLEQAHSKYGQKLVIVASQELRYRALIGDEGNPELKLSDPSYCILERLGRARWQGEVQRDLHTSAFKMDAGKLHYLRKSLDRNGLITLQPHVVRLPSGARQHSILLLLKRFHIDRRSKYDVLMESTSNLLSELPNNIGIVLKLREQLRVGEHTFKRVYQYLQAAKIVNVVTIPLQEVNPEAGPYKTKKGTDIKVRCLKLLKPYTRKIIEDDDDDEDENNDDEGLSQDKRNVQAQPRDIERDMLAQAYEYVMAAGSKGISQSALRGQLNIGKLESRMIVRILERNNMIKGFMEDEGRQRTTKYICKELVEKSKLNQQFTKERERSQKLQAPQHPENPDQPDPRDSQGQEDMLHNEQESEEEKVEAVKGKTPKSKARKKETRRVRAALPKHSTPVSDKMPCSKIQSDQSVQEAEPDLVEERDDSLLNLEASAADHTHSIIQNQSQCSITVVEEVVDKPEQTPLGRKKGHEQHETYRLLKRKNVIIEAVRKLKVIEGLHQLQKKVIDEEKEDGVSTKICKKSIVRLARSLSREGYLRLFRTTVVQDGVSRKMEFVVHPSITPDDPRVKSAIEQVRFKISSSYTMHRLKKQQEEEEEKAKTLALEQSKEDQESGSKNSEAQTVENDEAKELKNFKPTIVPGLSRSLGFQPKMTRFRMVHTFLFYLIYEHPCNQTRSNDSSLTSDPTLTTSPVTSEPEVTPATPLSSTEKDVPPEDPQTRAGEEEYKVYANEVTWKRFVPPLRVHREFGHGWALISDVLISLPLSIYVQVIQLNYKVDGLDEFLSDPVKQHYLITFLPSSVKTKLLLRRKYFFSFYENLQRLCFIGLLQFGPVEKFMDKDQGFFYLKKNATIVDTTVCEPHYNLAIETRPFDRRRYTFNTAQDVENYWFDLLCVCLNTPLGVVRPRSRGDDKETEESETAAGPIRYERLQHMLKGSCEVVDDGVIPGDGMGAGGLDSSFFSHLKRNWLWTTHLLSRPKKSGIGYTVRLRNLLSKHTFPNPASAANQGAVGGSNLVPLFVLEDEVQMDVEPSSRNQKVRGGKKGKRKRQKKETSKPPKKKRKVVSVRKQTLCQDEIDRKALMRMTRQRVTWTHLEDSILMLCRVASHFLNRKIKKPFVSWNVVRDILHAELELSLDKTSLSVGRRSRYIMKNPQTQLNYRICLAEVYQDKALIEDFMNRTNNYEDLQVCAEEFKEFVNALRSKFSSSYGASDMIIPDSKEELFARFKVYVIGEEQAHRSKDVLTRVEDIHSLVLNNLIQSTLVLSNSQMKSCQSFQSYSLYSKYNPEVLQQAFLSCKKRGLVNRRRANKVLGPRKNRAIPFMPMSYQLSQHYYRYFTWRFPSTVCNELHHLLEALRKKEGMDRSSTFSFQQENVAEGPKNGDETKDKEKEEERESRNDHDKQSKEAENRKEVEQLKGHQDGGDDGQQMENFAGDPSMNTGDVLEFGEDSLVPPSDVEDMLTFPIDATGGASLCCLSLMTLGLLSVDVSIPQQVVVVDSTLVDNDIVKSITKELDEDEEEDGGRLEVKARQASHTNYLLIKGYFVPGIISLRNINSTEHIAVNSCTIRIRLRQTPLHTLFTETGDAQSVVTHPSIPSVLASLSRMFKQCGDKCRSSVRECERVLGYSDADTEAVQTLRTAVQECRELGIDRLDLYKRFSCLKQLENGRTRTLQQYIQDLMDNEELLEVGGLAPRLVCLDFSAPWLLQTPTHVSEEVCQALAIPESLKRSLTQSSPPSGSHGPPPAKRAAKRAAKKSAKLTVAMETAAMGTASVESVSKESVVPGTVTPEVVAKEIVPPETAFADTATVTRETIAPETDTMEIATVTAVAMETTAPETVTIKSSTDESAAMETVPPVGECGGENVGEVKSSPELSTSVGTEERPCDDAGTSVTSASPLQTENTTQTPATGEKKGAKDSEEEEALSFVARPWRIVDGSLNRPVCKGMLEALLLHIMTNPGVTEPALLNYYNGVLQPVVILDLLQVLTELGCLRKRFTRSWPKASLFSRPSVPKLKSQEEVSVVEEAVTFYEPTVDCSLKLSQVFPGETNWNKWVQLCVR